MNKKKILSGLLGALVGFIALIFIIEISAKPENTGVSFKLIESLETYYFAFIWGMGDLGWVVGTLLLIAFLTLFYFIGTWIYKKTR